MFSKRFLSEKINSLGHTLNMPLLTAVAWWISLRQMSEISQKGRATKKLIVLAKSGGIDDLRSAFSLSPASFQIYVLPRRIVKLSFRQFISEDKVCDAKYVTTNRDTENSKLKYRNYLKQVLKHFKALYGCDAIMQFNIAYHAERELAAASSEVGIPFICNYKECLRSTALWRETEITYKKNIVSFQGWKIAVYNEQAREAIINSGIATSGQVETIGCARLDYSHRLRDTHQAGRPRRKRILFFLIQNTAGLPFFGGIFTKDGRHIQEKEGMCLTWHSVATTTNDVMLEFARKNPDIDLIFKGKTGHSKSQRNRLGDSLPINITVISDGTGGHLLRKADIVVGFQSTAVLEAIAAGKPTIVPALLSTNELHLRPYIHDLEGAAVVAKSADELEQALVNAVQSSQIRYELTANQKRVLNKYLGNDDGRAGERLRKFIEKAVFTSFNHSSMLRDN